jgi:hypothetical protein
VRDVGGYQVRTESIRVGVGDYLSDNSSTVDAVQSNFGNVTLPGVAAGQSVSGELEAVVSAWTEALPKIKKEIQLIAEAVSDSATMYEKVEVMGSRPFDRFAS